MPRRNILPRKSAHINDFFCPGPKRMAKGATMVDLIRSKLLNGASGSQNVTGVSRSKYIKVRNAMKGMLKSLSRQRREIAQIGILRSWRKWKMEGSHRRRIRCFCRQMSYLELFLQTAASGEELQCRPFHYYELPDVSSPNTNGKDSGPPGTKGLKPATFKLRPGLLLPKDSGYYQYFGSLTSPPCSEVVNWIVMKQPLKITLEQLTALRELESTQDKTPVGEYGNVRPSQPLSGRVVVTNEPC
ncbi:hypothetical protein ACOMHN_027143 [Nucella lapillus]